MTINEKNNTKIAHIIYNDKFTLGYIQFMKFYFSEYDQMFLVVLKKNDKKQDYPDEGNVLYFLGKGFSKNSIVLKILNDANKIIVSGLFGYIPKEIAKLNNALISKMYLQFWGGDFYKYKKGGNWNLQKIKRALVDKRRLAKCIKKCAGIINLISTEWDEFYKIFPFDVKHIIAPMAGDPEQAIDYNAFRNKMCPNGSLRILVGNSATESNHHVEVFSWLKRFVNENMEVVVPLSYGKESYKNKILKIGEEMLGSRFNPLTEFMNKHDYIELLNSCDIGIFNVDRQQAMGNINGLFSLGKKVYLRKDTSMWNYYQSFGVLPYDIAEIRTCGFDELKFVNQKVADQNIMAVSNLISNDRKASLWKKVFYDKI